MCFRGVNCLVLTVAVFVSIGGTMTGYVSGSMNGVLEMEGFQETYRYLYNGSNGSDGADVCSTGNGAGSATIIGVIVSMTTWGSFVGSLLGGYVLADLIGRKYGLAVCGVLMVLGAILKSSSYYVSLLVIGRFLSGISIGAIYAVMPIYLSEISPKEHRGAIISICGPMYNIGFFLVLGLNIGFEKFFVGWRLVFAILAVMGLVYAIGMLYVPFTPSWLVKKGRDQEALLVINRVFRSRNNAENTVNAIFELEELKERNRSLKPGFSFLLKELLKVKYRLFIAICLFVIEGFTGVFLHYYSTTIFCEVGIEPFYSSLLIGMVVLLGSIVLIFVIDRMGRKNVLLFGTLFNFISGLAVAALIQFKDDINGAPYVIVVLISAYGFSYTGSWLVVPWVIASEIFPVSVRGLTNGIATSTYWGCAAVSNQLTPIIVGSFLELHGFFYITTGFNLFGIFFVLCFLPETKGISLGAMDELFSQSICQNVVEYFRCNKSTEVTISQQIELDKDLETYTDIKLKDDIL